MCIPHFEPFTRLNSESARANTPILALTFFDTLLIIRSLGDKEHFAGLRVSFLFRAKCLWSRLKRMTLLNTRLFIATLLAQLQSSPSPTIRICLHRSNHSTLDRMCSPGLKIQPDNDQYINHIMNETGATVLLRGKGAKDFESLQREDFQQPLHLYLSCTNLKSLDNAKVLAENLLDTVAAECGASRSLSSKAYNAVPPPQKLFNGVESSMNETRVNTGGVSSLTSLSMCSAPAPPISTLPHPGLSNQSIQEVSQSIGSLNYVKPWSNTNYYSQPSLSSGTCYSGYGGIYPQATPLQQVALVLKQAPFPVISASLNATEKTPEADSKSISVKEKFPPQKRKFQELPVISRQSAIQEIEDYSLKNISTIPAPKKLVQPFSNGMPPPPPQMKPPPPPPKFASSPVPSKGSSNDLGTKTSCNILPPPPRMDSLPPPPKFTSYSAPSKTNGKNSVIKPHSVIQSLPSRMNYPPLPKFKSSLEPLEVDVSNSATKSSSDLLPRESISESLPDTLTKLVEYGAEDDDDAEETDEIPKPNPQLRTTPKPFWAL